MEGKRLSDYLLYTLNNLFLLNNSSISLMFYSTMNNSELDILEDALIGDLLGDGYLGFHGKSTIKKNKRVYTSNARMEFTFSIQNLPYLRHLKYVVYKRICTSSEPTPWPNPKTEKVPTQYWFSTRSLPLLTKLDKEWYQYVDGKYVKFIPRNIKILLKPIGLAHWIMGDGFWANGGIIICTDCFSFEEVNMLVDAIRKNFGLDARIITRISNNGTKCWRIRIRGSSVKDLRNLIIPYMIPEMLYKVGIK